MSETMSQAVKPIRASVPKAAAAPATTFGYAGSQGPHALKGQEWVLANGLGGFAMGTALGVPTRRYHALLIAATKPPVGRVAALNAMVERAEIEGGGAVEFSSFEFNRREPALHPDGHTRLVSFEADESCRWRWVGEGLELTREVVVFRGANAVGLRYGLRRSGAETKNKSVKLVVRPLVSLRDFHALIRRSNADRFAVRAGAAGVEVTRDGLSLSMAVGGGAARFVEDGQWWYDFFYGADADRGQDCVEDLFSPGAFEIELAAGLNEAHVDIVSWVVSAQSDGKPHRSIDEELSAQRARNVQLAAAAAKGCDPSDSAVLGILARAADAFVVARRDAAGGLSGVSTIAGYPWFSDWGRDAFISLPGLLLATGRHEEALRELTAFARARKNGIIPNVFNDQTGEPEYNTVDASLWFIHAACRWLDLTGDRAAFNRELREACIDVIRQYRKGTDYNIAMDPIDRLITAGTGATQLTWMDARRDGVTFTPRHGKAVEINALWYNALRSLSAAVAPEDGSAAANLNDLADTVAKTFAVKFWNEKLGCLFDCLTPTDDGQWVPDGAVRPNQLLAVSLPFSPLDARKQRSVLDYVKLRLLTPMGVRTLDPVDSRYRGQYRGSLFERDGAYHQGTVWPWLLGPLAEGVLRAVAFSTEARREAREIIQPMLATLVPGARMAQAGTCPGQIAEVFDGDVDDRGTQKAGGCPAQAWSVAELLRVTKLLGA